VYTKFQGQMMHQKNVIQNLPTLVDVENFSLLPTLTASQSLKYCLFSIKFLEQKYLCVNKIWYKFQGQIINKTKDINNLPTCVVVGTKRGKPFHCYQLWHPPNGWEIVYLPWTSWHNMIFMMKKILPNFKANRFTNKKLFKIYQHW
jgi:hypothetical protein